MAKNSELYPHYYKAIPPELSELDIYAVLDLFEVTDQKVGHAVKKLLCLGNRGSKEYLQDLKEARDTLNRAIDLHTITGRGKKDARETA
jgi:hypothetical protein